MEYKVDEIFTISGCYKRRTFMQWLRREKKQLKQFKITAVNGDVFPYEEFTQQTR